MRNQTTASLQHSQPNKIVVNIKIINITIECDSVWAANMQMLENNNFNDYFPFQTIKQEIL